MKKYAVILRYRLILMSGYATIINYQERYYKGKNFQYGERYHFTKWVLIGYYQNG